MQCYLHDHSDMELKKCREDAIHKLAKIGQQLSTFKWFSIISSSTAHSAIQLALSKACAGQDGGWHVNEHVGGG